MIIFQLLGEEIAFSDQVIFFQSKSITDMVRILMNDDQRMDYALADLRSKFRKSSVDGGLRVRSRRKLSERSPFDPATGLDNDTITGGEGVDLIVEVVVIVVEVCGAEPLQNIHGASWVPLLRGDTSDWRRAWYYEYNYEKQFPYTPNVRGIRTDRWKYMRYPHGDGGPDRHKAELYDLRTDPKELHNLVDAPEHATLVKRLHAELDRLIARKKNLEAVDAAVRETRAGIEQLLRESRVPDEEDPPPMKYR